MNVPTNVEARHPRRHVENGPNRAARARTTAFAVLIALVVLPAAGLADWLVTVDGERIETRGPWRVEGTRVLFHLPNGTLTALRASEVDLDQSRLASAEQPQPPAPRAAPRQPVLVLTDENVASAPAATISPEAGSPQGEGSAGEGDAAAGEPPAGEVTDRRLDLEVSSWREETAETGIRFLGTVENGSPDFATLVTVEVALYDEAGALIDTQPARLARSSIAPGASTTFDVMFDGVYAYGDAVFTPDGRALRARPPAEPENEDGGADVVDPDAIAAEAVTEPPAF